VRHGYTPDIDEYEDPTTGDIIAARVGGTTGAIYLGDTSAPRLPHGERDELSGADRHDEGRAARESGRAPWADLVWLPCRDGKARPVEPTIFPLAHGVPDRVGLLRGAGNAIVPQTAATFIRAYLEAEEALEIK
jgi:hypothetical protein